MFVKLDKPEFIGKEALAKQKAEGVTRRIVGLELEGNAIPRHGYPVEVNGEQIGEITTGYRITFEAPILRHFTVELDKI